MFVYSMVSLSFSGSVFFIFCLSSLSEYEEAFTITAQTASTFTPHISELLSCLPNQNVPMHLADATTSLVYVLYFILPCSYLLSFITYFYTLTNSPPSIL